MAYVKRTTGASSSAAVKSASKPVPKVVAGLKKTNTRIKRKAAIKKAVDVASKESESSPITHDLGGTARLGQASPASQGSGSRSGFGKTKGLAAMRRNPMARRGKARKT